MSKNRGNKFVHTHHAPITITRLQKKKLPHTIPTRFTLYFYPPPQLQSLIPLNVNQNDSKPSPERPSLIIDIP